MYTVLGSSQDEIMETQKQKDAILTPTTCLHLSVDYTVP